MRVFQRFIAFVAAVVLALPLSLYGETRSRQRTDMRAMAAELAAVLGTRSVELRGGRRPSSPVPATARTTSDSITMNALVEEMNRYRAQAGLRPLRLEQRLNRAAADRIDDMYSQGYFDHIAPDGTQPFVWARRHSYRYRTIGENLAAGYPTARQVVAGWMNSPGHRANILSRGFEDVGLAMSDGFPGRGRIAGPTVVALYAAEM